MLTVTDKVVHNYVRTSYACVQLQMKNKTIYINRRDNHRKERNATLQHGQHPVTRAALPMMSAREQQHPVLTCRLEIKLPKPKREGTEPASIFGWMDLSKKPSCHHDMIPYVEIRGSIAGDQKKACLQ